MADAAPRAPDADDHQGPSRLRLSRLLGGLTRRAEARATAPPAAAEPGAAGPDTVARASGAAPADHDADGSITMDEVIEHTHHAGFGFLIAFLALVAIPFFGLSTPFGLAIALLGGQLLAGRERPWLPRKVGTRAVGARTLRWLSDKLARATGWLEALVKPRWHVLSGARGMRVIGLGLIVLGVGLALPIPIPGSNWIFLAPILVYAIGLLEDDGAVIAVGHACTVLLVAGSVVFSHIVIAALTRVWHWLAGLFGS